MRQTDMHQPNLKANAKPQRLRPRIVDAVVTVVATSLMALICHRVGTALDSPLPIAALFAVPVALSARSLTLTFSSLLAVFVAGFALLFNSPEASLHGAAFAFAGTALMAAVVYCSIAAGARLRDTRTALASVRAQSKRTAASLNKAGVCIIVLDRNLTWLSVNEAAWGAFGCDMRLRAGPEGRVELDDEAASALMQSSSRESWRRLLESVKADADAAASKASRATSLSPRLATLYTLTGEAVLHRFTVTVGANGELAFVGVPIQGENEESPESGVSLKQWMAAVARSIDEPAVVLQADGCLLATNPQFDALVGKQEPGARIFDLEQVEGVEERTYSTRIWAATRRGAVALPWMTLGKLEGLGARLNPPGAPHMEAVLLMFRGAQEPVPPSFEEHTTMPADL